MHDIASVLCFGFFSCGAWGILAPNQGSNPQLLHWKANWTFQILTKMLTTKSPGKSLQQISYLMMVPNPEARPAPLSCPLTGRGDCAWCPLPETSQPRSLHSILALPWLRPSLSSAPHSCLLALSSSFFSTQGSKFSLWKTVLILFWPLYGCRVRSRPFAAWPKHVWVHLGWLCLPWTPSHAEHSQMLMQAIWDLCYLQHNKVNLLASHRNCGQERMWKCQPGEDAKWKTIV